MSAEVSELQGTDLRQAVLAGRVGPEATAPLLLKLATALTLASASTRARPSLKPRHIRVDAAGEPIELEGSMLPVAPEGQGAEGLGERRDVFGLGITGLFVLSGGRLPTDLLSRLEAFVATLDCSQELGELLCRACAHDPALRYGTIAEFRDALMQVARASDVGPVLLADEEESCQLLLRQDPTRLDAYRRLFELYQARDDRDRAFCVARALVFLERADEMHRGYFEQHARRGPIRPSTGLDEASWVKDLMHPGEDLLLGKLLAAITPALIGLRMKSDKALGLRDDQRVADVEGSTITIARSFAFVGRVLSLPALPRLYLCPDREGGLGHVAAQPPASVCCKGVLSGIDPVDLTFVVTKHLSDCRDEHYARTLLRASDLEVALALAKQLAGCEVVLPDADWPAKLARKVSAPARAHLQALGQRFPKVRECHDIASWLHAVELTAYRAGLLMCDDLAIAARMAGADPGLARHGLTREDVLRELLVFGVSEPYFRLRAHLGIAH